MRRRRLVSVSATAALLVGGGVVGMRQRNRARRRAYVDSWRKARFSLEETDELLRHMIFLEEALAWRRAGMSVATASERGRYRLSPDDMREWSAHGFRASAAYTCKSLGLSPEEAVAAYARGEDPPLAAARRRGETATWLSVPGWLDRAVSCPRRASRPRAELGRRRGRPQAGLVARAT